MSPWALTEEQCPLITSKCCKFKNEVGLCRDDGLAICKATPKEIEKTKQAKPSVQIESGLKITIDANKKIVNFIDRCDLKLTNGSYKPYIHTGTSTFFQILTHQRINLTPLEGQQQQLKLTSDWQQTLRNVTEMTSHPFDISTEKIEQS